MSLATKPNTATATQPAEQSESDAPTGATAADREAANRDTADENARIAERLREMSSLLEAQGANPFRAGAYRKAAATIEGLGESVRAIFDRGGPEGLDALPGVGRGIRSAIAEMLITGRWSQLDRLRGSVAPEALLQSVPGIGPELAKRIHNTLGIDSLEALEAAAHDGRLDAMTGIGQRRIGALRASLQRMLGRPRHIEPASPHRHHPPVAMLLDIDREYRERAVSGQLPTIAPKRFNPQGTAWLPVLHTERDGWHCTALYSNTPRAHELGRAHDWVVIYCYDDDHTEDQHTVVTESRGSLAGRRVVRGREAACRSHYGHAS